MRERRRTGAETKAEARRVALELFGTQGYEATSLRQIADVLGINKASLYYHFASKEEIVRSTFADRGSEAHELLDWARRQPPGPDLTRRTVLRWVESFSVDKLRGVAFVAANPALVRGIGAELGAEITAGLEALVDFLAGPQPEPVRTLRVRMALLSINAAVAAAAGTDLPDEVVVAAARENALALLDRL